MLVVANLLLNLFGVLELKDKLLRGLTDDKQAVWGYAENVLILVIVVQV